MFKIPSLRSFFSESIITFKRFPLSVLASIIATAVAMLLIRTDDEKLQFINNYWKVIMCCCFGGDFVFSSLFLQFNFTAIFGDIDENDSLSINNINAKVLIKRK